MLNADVFGAKPKIPRTPTNSFANPAFDNAFEPQLFHSSSPTENLIDTSALTVPNHTPSQPLLEFFTTPYNRDEATNAPLSPIESASADNKTKSNILSRLRSNTAYKSVDKLDKTPPRKSWARQKDRQPLLPSPPSFLSRLASRLSPARTFNATPVGRLTTTFAQYLEKRSADGKPGRRADSPLISRREGITDFSLSTTDQPTSISHPLVEDIQRETPRSTIDGATCMETTTQAIVLHSCADIQQTETDRHNTSFVLDTEPAQPRGNSIDSNGTQDIEEEQIVHLRTDRDIRDIWETILDDNPRAVSQLTRSIRLRSKGRRVVSGFSTTKRHFGQGRERGISRTFNHTNRRHHRLALRSNIPLSEDIPSEYSDSDEISQLPVQNQAHSQPGAGTAKPPRKAKRLSGFSLVAHTTRQGKTSEPIAHSAAGPSIPSLPPTTTTHTVTPQPPPSTSRSSTPTPTTTHTVTPQPPPSTSRSSTLTPTTTTTLTATPRPTLSTIGSSIGAPQASTQTQPGRTNTGRSVSFSVRSVQPRPPVGASSYSGGQRNPAPPTKPRGTSQQSRKPHPFPPYYQSKSVAPTTSAPAATMATNNSQSAHYPALADFQKDLHIRSSLQALPSFTGNPLVRFDSWLESFESVIARSDFSEDDVILELRGKLTDKAHKVIKYIIDNNPKEYDTIREKLLDHFHGDETVEKYVKKFKKAHRKPGEKIYDYAIRLQEIFKHAYPDSHAEDSFKVILKEKFIEGLDEKLQFKVKYKDYDTFDELVAATRKYLARMEAVENTREKQEFVNAINQTSESHSMQEMRQEIKQLIENQKETVNAIASGFRLDNRQSVGNSDTTTLTAHIAKLTEAMATFFRGEEKPPTSQSQHHTQKAVSFHHQQHTPQSTSYTPRPQSRQNQPFGNRAAGQHYTPRAPSALPPPIPATPPTKILRLLWFPWTRQRGMPKIATRYTRWRTTPSLLFMQRNWP